MTLDESVTPSGSTEELDAASDGGQDNSQAKYHRKQQKPQNNTLVGKTPVSLLQELYVRRGIYPKYDLVQIEGQVHEPIFKYRANVGEFIATGCGQSKKKAKHAAARAILNKLIDAQNAGKAPAGQPLIPDLASQISSPYEDGIEGNPVGVLQEMCMARRWPPPIYDLKEGSDKEVPPHERSFTIHCIANGRIKEIGTGKSKKLAKRQAASKMINRLNDEPNPNDGREAHNLDEDDIAQGVAMRHSQMRAAKEKMGSNQSQQVSRFHKNFKSTEGDCILKLRNLSLKEIGSCTDDHVAMLEGIAKEQMFITTFVDVEEISKSNVYQCLVQMSTYPVSVCYGSGETPEEARQAAALNGLQYLRVMLKK